MNWRALFGAMYVEDVIRARSDLTVSLGFRDEFSPAAVRSELNSARTAPVPPGRPAPAALQRVGAKEAERQANAEAARASATSIVEQREALSRDVRKTFRELIEQVVEIAKEIPHTSLAGISQLGELRIQLGSALLGMELPNKVAYGEGAMPACRWDVVIGEGRLRPY